MAKPLWNLIYRNLDRALAVCALSPCEQVVMEHARELSYGPARLRQLPDPLPFHLNASWLARESGFTRPRINDALSTLKQTGLLIDAPGYVGLLIQKDYRQWSGRHKLSAKLLSYCDACTVPDRAHVMDAHTVPDREHPLCPTGNTPCSQTGTVHADLHHNNARASEDSQKTQEDTERGVRVTNKNGESERIQIGDPPDPADLAKLRTLAFRLFEGSNIDREAVRFAEAGVYPPGWIAAALEASVGKAKAWAYVHTILKRYAAQGGPDKVTLNGKPKPKDPPLPALYVPDPDKPRRQLIPARSLKNPRNQQP